MTLKTGPDSASLFLLSTALRERADSLTHRVIAHETHWKGLYSTGFAGIAAESAVGALQRESARLDYVATEISAAAAIVAKFASVFVQWENLRNRLRALAMQSAITHIDNTPVETLLHRLDDVGSALDWACARSLDALCTPALAEPPRRLEDVAGLPARTVHEVMLPQAPPAVRQLVADYPELTLLEVGDGQVVAAIGDIDQAEEISTFVAGVNSSEPATWPSQVERVKAIAEHKGGAAVMWLGYNAPESLAHATHKEPARRGAVKLARFQKALDQRNPHAHKTVIGYSYGSVVAGQAALGGLATNDLVLVGSPGAVASHAREFELHGENPRVFATTGKQDIIALTTDAAGGVHGVDPTSQSFGAKAWPTKYSTTHTEYFSNPDFLRGLGRL